MSVNDILNQIEQSHIELALRSIDDGVEHHFADSTTYDVLYEGRRYPPKAVVGVAAYHAKQVVLRPSDFKGGLKSKCFRVLEFHGFEIVPKDSAVSNPFDTDQPDDASGGTFGNNGQGFRSDVKVRLALEAYSMNTARAHYEARGWVVKDVSGNHPYDFHCTKEGEVDRRVEVKGTTTAGASVLLTANEVAHAKEHHPHVDLFIVHSIVLTYETGQEPTTSGGVIQKLSPWRIQDENLKALSYQYTV